MANPRAVYFRQYQKSSRWKAYLKRYRQTPQWKKYHSDWKKARRKIRSEQEVQHDQEQYRRWAQNNREHLRRYGREYLQKRLTETEFKIRHNLRRRMHHALRGECKSARTRELLGCDAGKLIQHLESQFKPGFSWDNYGTVWEIDHKRPCVLFDLTDPAQQKLCFHWSNLAPLEKFENRSRGAKLKSGKVIKYGSGRS